MVEVNIRGGRKVLGSSKSTKDRLQTHREWTAEQRLQKWNIGQLNPAINLPKFRCVKHPHTIRDGWVSEGGVSNRSIGDVKFIT